MVWSGGVNRTDDRLFSGTLRRYLPSDWAVSIYLAVTGLAVVFLGNNLNHRWEIVLLHFGLIAAIFAIIRHLSVSGNRVARFLRLFYIPLLLTFFYEETSLFLHLFHTGWLDSQVVALEQGLFGVSPSLWIQPWQKPLLNEWMLLGYFSYYLIIAVPLVILFLKQREHDAAQMVWAISLAFFISYLGFMAYPVQGPRFEFAELYDSELAGFLFVPLVNELMDTAAIHGGCMPSSHVAAAVVSATYITKHNRHLGMVCIPVVVTLCLGTVWGRFHYVSDVVAGIIIAIIVLWAARRYPVKRRRRNAGREYADAAPEHIS